MEQIAEAGAGFRSATENIDTNTPVACMMIQMVGLFADPIELMTRERTSAGIAVARAEGRLGGRRRKLALIRRRGFCYLTAHAMLGRSGLQIFK